MMNLHCDETFVGNGRTVQTTTTKAQSQSQSQNMDLLLCCETDQDNETRAYEDPALLTDAVLKNLLSTEERYAPPYSPLSKVQNEVTAEMRKIVAEWMLEVCEEQQCQEEVFVLAMNLMDRFLMTCCIRKNQLQLLGTTCMLISSKLREPRPLAAEILVYYTDHSITRKDLLDWELLVLSKLKWLVNAVTPQDFLRHLLNRLNIRSVGINFDMVNSHAKTLIALCAREFQFSKYHPSIIACASVASALCGVGWRNKTNRQLKDLLEDLHNITQIEVEYVEQCLQQIEDMIKVSTNQTRCDKPAGDASLSGAYDQTMRPDQFTPPPKYIKGHETAVTPTDVYDVRF